MTRSTSTVTFPDGTEKHVVHNHTTDQWWAALRDTSDEVWELVTLYKSGDWATFGRLAYPAPCGEVFDVLVDDPYDFGFDGPRRQLPGKATLNALIECEVP